MGAMIRKRNRSRQTGHYVRVEDCTHPEATLDADDGGRWATICEEHGDNVQHLTLADATAWSSEPLTWCAGCQCDNRTCEIEEIPT